MSRIGAKIIIIPADVQVALTDTTVKVTGKYGTLEKKIFTNLKIKQKDNELSIHRSSEDRKLRALHGLMRTLLNNMILGVSQQFSKTLIAEGIGYKFLLNAEKLSLNVGFTNPIFYIVPPTLKLVLESPTRLLIIGIDIEEVGLFAATIRSARPPEPYKGKGVRYSAELIHRKLGKTKTKTKTRK